MTVWMGPRGIVPLLVLALWPHQAPARIATFWHVTDFHYDVNYTTSGSPDHMCWLASRAREIDKPGTFGDYACDSPLTLVHSAVNAMVSLHPDPDFLLWTGDDTAHVSDQNFSVDRVVGIVSILTNIIKDGFPNTPVIPVLGNHDLYPKNQAPLGPNPLQTQVANLWKGWLNTLSPEAYISFNANGRFWCDVEGTSVSVVAFNTLLWYKSNNNTAFLPDSLDPDAQFAWADHLLSNLTLRNRRVYLVGHIPPGTFERYQQKREGFHWYQERYNYRFIQLVEKHADTIEAQFFAHHHTDSFRLFFKDQKGSDPGTPVSYQLLAPGVTPWRSTLSPETGANNPGFRLVHFDTVTGQVKEVTTYFLPLAEANSEGRADWQLEYNFSSTYQLEALTPQTLYELAKKLKTDRAVFEKYYLFNTMSLEDPANCTEGCERLHWCAITELNYTRFNTCNSGPATYPSGTLLLSLLLLLPLLVP